jgi:hypothetical protein
MIKTPPGERASPGSRAMLRDRPAVPEDAMA